MSKLKILIVDDREENLFALEQELEGPDRELVKATSGNEALKLLLYHEFALAILDVQMPEMDGYELAELMRGAARSSEIPIIFLTAVYSDAVHIFRGYESGAVDFITKPFNPVMLHAKVDTFLQLARQTQDLKTAKAEQDALIAKLVLANSELDRNVEELKTLQTHLEQAKVRAEQANTAKSEFLANMSHEIRTPMGGVLGMLQLLQHTSINQEQEKLINIALQSGASLLQLINDILDLSRIEAGEVALNDERFSLQSLADEIHSSFMMEAQHTSNTLTVSIDDNVPAEVVADQGKLRQVLFNLIGNALKFTDGGAVHTSISLLPHKRRANEAFLLFMVRDTGIGIPDEAANTIFSKFKQADSSHTRRHKGVGLGLSIVTKFVTLWEGSLTLETQEGEGSIFYFTYPAATPREKTSPAELGAPKPLGAHPPLRILVAEDDMVNQLTAKGLLKKLGHSVICVENGEQAVETFQTEPLDVIFMDIQMPVMSGLDAVAAIRASQNGVNSPDIPVIALTAHALSGDREHFLEAGMNEYVSKPLNISALQSILHEVLPVSA